jgi:hypothetical protein
MNHIYYNRHWKEHNLKKNNCALSFLETDIVSYLNIKVFRICQLAAPLPFGAAN